MECQQRNKHSTFVLAIIVLIYINKIPYLGMEKSSGIPSWLGLLSTNTAFFLTLWTSSVVGPARPCSCSSCCLDTDQKDQLHQGYNPYMVAFTRVSLD